MRNSYLAVSSRYCDKIVVHHRSTLSQYMATIPISESHEIITTRQYMRHCPRTVVYKLQTIGWRQCRASWMAPDSWPGVSPVSALVARCTRVEFVFFFQISNYLGKSS